MLGYIFKFDSGYGYSLFFEEAVDWFHLDRVSALYRVLYLLVLEGGKVCKLYIYTKNSHSSHAGPVRCACAFIEHTVSRSANIRQNLNMHDVHISATTSPMTRWKVLS